MFDGQFRAYGAAGSGDADDVAALWEGADVDDGCVAVGFLFQYFVAVDVEDCHFLERVVGKYGDLVACGVGV